RTFQVVTNGKDYYVNDGSTTGDQLTKAVGANANSGKDPAAPMASLYALIQAYDLDAGDVVHVDTGNYTLYRNLLLTLQDSGVTIQGPTGSVAQLDRANMNSSSYEFELGGANDITLDHLTMTGGVVGVYGADGANSDRLTVSNCDIFGNYQD